MNIKDTIIDMLAKTMSLVRLGLKLNHLRVIAAFAETGQIGLAAQQLGMTQPAASRLMAEIERITRRPVHRRDGRGAVLTPEGAALAARAVRILLEIDAADREMSEISVGRAGKVSIGSVTGPALDLVLPAVRSALHMFPEVAVEVEIGSSDVLAGMLLAGRVDFVLARVPGDIDPALVSQQQIGLEPVCLVARRGHALVAGIAVEPRDLLAYDWVMPRHGAILRRAVEQRFTALGLPLPNVRLATSSFLLTLALLQQSDAVAPLAVAVARQFATGQDAPYVIVPFNLKIEVEAYAIVTRAYTILTPVAEMLRQMVLQQALM
jgi:DNA-binding transcriptional LysR family regulator